MLIVQNKLNVKTMVKKIPDFEYGTIWEDPISGHKIGCLDEFGNYHLTDTLVGVKNGLITQ